MLFNACWAAILVADARATLDPVVIFWVEVVRAGFWTAALLAIGRDAISRHLHSFMLVAGAVLAVSGILMVLGQLPDLLRPGRVLSIAGMVLAVAILVLLEQIYRNAGAQSRWSLKFLVFGIGGAYAFDFFMYAEADVLKFVSAGTWQARGFINALLLPMVLIAARRNPAWQLDVFVSRQVTFYTGAITAVGIYSLLMVTGINVVRYLGGEWGVPLQTTFLTCAAALLLLLVFSGNIRRRTRVFLTKHFYRNKYDYRVEWLRFVKTLAATAEEGVALTATRAVAEIFDSSRCALLVTDDAGRRLIPQGVWPGRLSDASWLRELDTDSDLARYLLRSRWVIDLDEYRLLPDRYENVRLPDWLSATREARLIAPLVLSDRLIGVLLLQKPAAPFELTYEDRDLLKTLCQHIATHVAQQLADRRLAENRQFEAHGKLTAFMMHDLKNSAAQLQLLVTNSARHKHNPEFLEDAISTAGNAVERINRLIQQLSGKPSPGTSRPAALSRILEEAAARCSDRLPRPDLKLNGLAGTVNCDPARLVAIVEHVLRNAQDATTPGGTIAIDVHHSGTHARISVDDTGAGMSADFMRDRLFRPFDSTKGAKGMGIGAYQVREGVRELGGDVDVSSQPGKGTRFSFTLPLVKVEQEVS